MIPKIDYTLVGRRMKHLRKIKGYTQEQIAEELGVTVAFISNIENNRTKLNLRILTYYADLLHVSIDYILFACEEDQLSMQLEQEIMTQLQLFSVEEKQTILKVLKAIHSN